MTRLSVQVFLLVCLFTQGGLGWHDFTSEDFHCWPEYASETNPDTTQSCPGVGLKWIIPPPDSIKVETEFNVTFQLILDPDFYTWAVTDTGKDNFFSYLGITDGVAAQNWCESVVCPDDESDVSKTTCCVHHVNIHSCPLSETAYCGPWIRPSGDTYTHSEVLWGSPFQANWTSVVGGLYVEGENQMIAHFKVAAMQMALFFDITVLPRTVCGDGLCEGEEGEDCLTCPKDCGRCPLTTWQISLIIVIAVLVVVAIASVVGYYSYKQRKLLWDESWIIPYEDIESSSRKTAVFGSTLSLGASLGSDSKIGSTVGEKTTQSAMQQSAVHRQIFAKVTMVHGKTCCIKEVPRVTMVLTKQLRKEVKQIRTIDHLNVCKFVGACIEVPNVCILAEYCPKGSLADVLQNHDIPLTWSFRFSFAHDIARGMHHLLNNDVIHGRLSSNNCVIDDRWTVKITDYGVPSLREPELIKEEEKDRMRSQLRAYLPPEALLTGAAPSQEGDVFAYSVLLVEIATRNDPYEDEDPCDLPDDWRPTLPDLSQSDTPDDTCPSPQLYTQLIQQCRSDRPADRPSFDAIKKSIQRMNPNQQSPVDLMMMMMQKYSQHLEQIVMERTADLVAEKQKTDRLLYSMLPRTVADDLRQGKSIDAQAFAACSIYFSDIVGFTTLSGKSNPFQIVNLLNELYTLFDSIIENYDVYKVETIGDAYMLVSGVPKPNGNKHAQHIALVAVNIVEACKTFVIPHLPKEPLEIRVGIHTGPVCAGVVGLKMPRYCLFGDTVNTASRMESNGEAYRIHLSNSTYEVLQQVGGFRFEARGIIPIKGKGEMKTWWLTEQETILGSDDKRRRTTSSSCDSGYNERVISDGHLTSPTDLVIEDA